ncbi:hypothetical protein MPTK1_4g18560 [Marchantia polymorpha subsp. ruderalis]|uniref:Uncharacterized protein n=2 Tax=Marchantia polymorpha TaxID=3197 RepID=A0AAF6BBA8_MARPO|nr:hypothetical protein MARPO_0041s0137 [Marchantia polymorpha]BBN09292.1 hypothetical protein Mp_4g18560 [Marchantia polymorpha subsp. ruderalis]|eukprot:PTQ40281.1 hypothetical protein MARPO_0041s0137 [Marchantia polymorpha]
MAAMMASSTVAAAGLRGAPLSSNLKRSAASSSSYKSVRAPMSTRRLGSIRCEGEVNESEKQSVFGAKPTSGSFYPRPEVERRPETGDKSLDSIFAFDGAAPETINGRLAMVGILWAAVAEKMSGLTVYEQLYTQGTGLVFYMALVPLIAYASIVPMLNGESTDARSFGPFTARAERWNGRLAMLGFLSLLLTESFIHAPVFRTFF